jgi:hypothetical protein
VSRRCPAEYVVHPAYARKRSMLGRVGTIAGSESRRGKDLQRVNRRKRGLAVQLLNLIRHYSSPREASESYSRGQWDSALKASPDQRSCLKNLLPPGRRIKFLSCH